MAEKILIVDDDIDSLKLIGLMLQRHGYEVIAANAGGQAIQKATTEVPNLIILDVMMPDMDGYDVTRRLRTDPITSEIPIIMFTAKTLIDDKVKAFELGADDYLTKPTHPAELASRVKAILTRNSQKGSAGEGGQSKLVLGVMGVKGGVGTTTLAVNMGAAMLAEEAEPIIVDLCLGHGTLGLFLGHGQVSSMANLLSKSPNEINERAIENQLVTHQSGLRLLLSSSRPKEALLTYSPETMGTITSTLRTMSNTVILDMGNQLTAGVNRAVRSVDKLLIVVEPNKVALTMARELFQMFEVDGVEREKLSVAVVNRSQSSLQTPWQEIEQSLGHEIKAIISAAPDLAFQAIEANVPLVLFRPNSITASQLSKLAEDFHVRVK